MAQKKRKSKAVGFYSKEGKVRPITAPSCRRGKRRGSKPTKLELEDLDRCAICGEDGAPWQPQGGVYAHYSCLDEVL